MIIHFAPLQGYADHLYRRLHAAHYGAADVYYTPFIRLEKGEPRRQDMARLESCRDDGTNLVPQIIFNTADEFKRLAYEVKSRGYTRIDLNLGCPFPLQTGKGRGAAMIANDAVMAEVAKLIADDNDCSYSVKMRLGHRAPDEWKRLIPLLNSVSLEHIAVHPRISKEGYEGELHMDAFREFSAESKNPVVFNGEIREPADIDKTIAEMPAIAGVMIGRGFLARPSIAAEWREGRLWSREERMERLMAFHADLFDAYESTLCGEAQILQKIKPFWDYLEPEIGHKPHKLLHKATSLAKYRLALEKINE